MRFLLNDGELVLASKIPEPKPPFEALWDDITSIFEAGGWVTEKTVKGFFGLVWEGVKVIWEGITMALPDIAAFVTILAGACIILSSMTKGGIMKPITYYSAFMIVVLCILGATK